MTTVDGVDDDDEGAATVEADTSIAEQDVGTKRRRPLLAAGIAVASSTRI